MSQVHKEKGLSCLLTQFQIYDSPLNNEYWREKLGYQSQTKKLTNILV